MPFAPVRKPSLIAGVVLAVGLAATAAGWQSAREAARAVARHEFEKRAADVAFRLRHGFSHYESVLRAGAALFSTGSRVDRAAWRGFVASTAMERRYPGMVALGYARHLNRREVAPALADMRRAGLPGFAVWPTSREPISVPVLASEPQHVHAPALGFDMFTEPTRRHAIELARDTGAAALTGHLTLVYDQAQPEDSGFLVYVPFYRAGAAKATVARRRQAIEGYVFGAFRMREALAPLAGQLPDGLDVAIYDGVQPAADQLMIDSAALHPVRAAGWRPAFHGEQIVELGRQVWTLRFSSRPEFEAQTATWLPTVVALSGTALSLMLAALVLVLARTRDRVLEVARGMTAELRAAMAELQAIYHSSPLGVWRADRRGRLVHGNARCEQICGRPGIEMTGEHWLEAVHPEDRERTVALWTEAVSTGAPYENEFRLRRGDGRWVWLNAKSAPIFRLGAVEGHVGTIEDVTAKHEAADAIERERQLLDSVLDAIPNAVFVKDARHRWVRVNQAFADLTGRSKQELIGRDDGQVLDAATAAQRFREDEEVLASGRRLVREQVSRYPDGTLRTLLKSKSPVQLPDGSLGVAGALTDIDAQKQAQTEAQAARELLDAVLEAVPVPVLVKDQAGRFLLLNQAGCDFQGVRRDWVVGKSDADIYPAPFAARIVEEDAQARSGDAVRSYEGPLTTFHGEQRWVVRRKRGVTLPGGQRGVVIAVHDVSELRQATQEAERARRYLDAVIDAIPQPVFVKDRAHRYVTVNAAFCAVLGQTKPALIGRGDRDFLLPDTAALAWAEDDRAFAAHGPMVFQGPGRSQATASHWYLRTKAAIRLDGVEYLTCVTTDITELKEAQSGAERSRAFLDALINAIPHPVFVKDRSHRWVLVNDAMCRMLGRSRDWMIGRTDADHFDPEHTRTVWAEDDAVFHSGRPTLTESRIATADGGQAWLLKSKSLIALPDGRQLIVAISTDITQRHEAELAAERNRQFLNMVLDAMPQGVFVKDEEGRWLLVNQATARMIGEPRERIEGRLPHDVLPRAFADAVVAQDRQALAHGGPLSFEQVPREVGGRTVWIMKTESAVRMPDGTRYLVGVNTDVSELKAATLQLQHAREFLDALLDAIPVPVLVKDAAHRRVFVNEAGCAFVGQPRQAQLGRTDAELFPELQAQLYARQDAAAFATDGVIQCEESFTRPGGDLRWVVKTKRAVKLADGSRYLIMVSLDITERKAAEAALEHSRSRLELVNAILAQFTSGRPIDAVLASAVRDLWAEFPDYRVCYSTIDAHGRLRVLHAQQPRHMQQLQGFEADLRTVPRYLERLRRGELSALTDPQQRPGSTPPWLGSHAAASLDVPLRHGEGLLGVLSLDASHPHRWTVHETDTLKKVAEALQAALQAVQTEEHRRRTERALHESEGKLRVALLASRVGLWTLDAAGWTLDLSRSWYEQLSLDPARPVRTAGDWAALVHPLERGEKLAHTREYLRNGRNDFEMEWRLLCGDGHYRHFLARGVIERSADGRVKRVSGAQIDITEIKHIEAELKRHRDHLQELVTERTREAVRAKEAAEAASRAKTEFLANMSHELRTPMHAILSFTRLGREKIGATPPPLARIEQYLERVEASGERLLALLNDLLDLSRLEAGKMRYEMSRADVAAVAASVIEECAGLARDRGLAVSLDVGAADTRAWCDPHRVAQVVRNLLSNAIKFSPEGGRVCILCEDARERGALSVTVRDEGTGIPQHELEAIFDKFVQSSKTQSGGGGTGLGLSISRQIVRDQGGRIWAGNNPQGGAFFTFVLPRHPHQAAPGGREEVAA